MPVAPDHRSGTRRTEHQADDVTIEVVDPTFGPNQEAERLPLAYIEYDPKDDVVVVAVGGRTARYPVLLDHGAPTTNGFAHRLSAEPRPEFSLWR